MILIKLFWVFFKVGLFAFGGGYATLPLITNFVVNENQWISLRELTDVLTISQMTPGYNSDKFSDICWNENIFRAGRCCSNYWIGVSSFDNSTSFV